MSFMTYPSALALRYRGLTLLLALVLIGVGVRAWLNLPIDAYPDISPTQTKIILKSPGMTPEEVEQRIVKPIEQELLSIPRKRMVRSVSKYGIADITLDFEEGTDIYWARQQVSERLASVMPDLPPAVSGGLAPMTTPLSELYMFTIEGEAYSLAQRRQVLDWVIRPELRAVPGVAEVNALGGEVRAFLVSPDPARMAQRGVTLADVQRTLRENNANDGAGRVVAGESALVVRVQGAIQTIDDLKALRVDRKRGEGQVFLEDVASVRTDALTRYGAVTQNGQGETVEGMVLGLRGVNARQLVTALQTRLAAVQTRLPEGMSIKTFYNRGDLVGRAVQTVIKALVEASVLVCVVLYLFLGGLRAALVVAVSLPLALLATFALMSWVGITANLMSLGGLAIALGMLVDASVVVVENIETELAQRHTPERAAIDLILSAVAQVIKPVVVGVSIICVVFLPLLTLEDLEGKLFSPVALTIVLALGASLLIALTVVPVLAYFLLKPNHGDEPALVRWLGRSYTRLRDLSWRHPRVLLASAGLALVLAVVLYGQLGKIFIPGLDEGDILVQLQKDASIALDASLQLDTRVQQAILQEVPEVEAIVARVGSDELGLDPMGLNETDTFLVLKPKESWRGGKNEVIDALRTVLDRFPGVDYGFTQPIEMRVSEMLTGTRGDVAIKLFAHDLNALLQHAQRVASAVRAVPGAAEVLVPKAEGFQYLTVEPDRYQLARAGLSVADLQWALRQQIEGETLGIVLEDGIRTPLLLRGDERWRQNPQALAEWPLTAPDGSVWRVGTLASIRNVDGPMRIDHESSQRLSTIQVTVEGRDLASFVAAAQQAVAELKLPNTVQVVWGGQFENQQRAAARLAIVIPAAMVTIFVLLTLSFGSAVQAGIIFLNVPFALIGGVVALYVSGEYLSVPASVGFIALLGIAVLNGVVMVTHFNERRARGEALAEVVRLGAERRLRPVLMTALITALGMIPLLFASGPGSEIQRPLAIVVTGGLLSATVLTLVLLPWVFARVTAWQERRSKV